MVPIKYQLYNSMNSANIPKSFCVLPWIHTAIDPDGTIRPCCMAEFNYRMGDLNKTPQLKDIFNNDQYKSFRLQMINGPELPAPCRSCKIQEDAGSASYRTRKNQEYADVIDSLDIRPDGSAEFKQLYIDYRFSNKCNFKCITCGPQLSTSHALEAIKLGNNHQKQVLIEVKDFAEQFKTFSQDIREIYFAGGEPLIIDHHYEILDMFIESQQPVYVHYNTNLSELNYKGIDVLSLWSKINGKIKIGASIDGFGPAGETIRFGLDSEVFKNNLKKIVTVGPSNVELNFNITFGVTNYRSVVDITRQLLKLMPRDRRFFIAYNPIFFPAEFAIHILSPEQLRQAVDLITQQIQELELEFADQDTESFNVYNAVKNLRTDFLQVIKDAPAHLLTNDRERVIIKAIQRLDNQEKIRKTNWRRDLPLMYRDWQEIIQDERSTQ
jgi:radical SAM protein with 4Fe4S-binding SPASM domain